jgi:hypothetical protein
MASKSQRHSLDEAVGFVVAQTGWTLEYVCALPIRQFKAIAAELYYQKAVRNYELSSHTVAIQLAMARLAGDKHQRTVKDVLGEPPRHQDFVQEGLFMAAENSIVLSNGKSYLARPINLNMMAAVEEKFNDSFPKLLSANRMAVLRHLLYLMLREDTPELTEDRVGQLVTIDLLGSIADGITKQVGNG